MEDEIINFVVAMDQRSPVPWLQLLVLEKPDQILKVRQLADGLLSLDVHGLGLAVANCVPGLNLAVIEPNWLAKLLQPHGLVIDGMETRQGAYRLSPHNCPLLRLHTRHSKVLEDASVEELHHVEGGADDSVVFTETVGLWDRHVCILEGVHNTVLALDLVRRLGQELARGLLSHNIFVAIGGYYLIRGIRLTKTKLFNSSKNARQRPVTQTVNNGEAATYLLQLDRTLDHRHMLGKVFLESLLVNGLSHTARHRASSRGSVIDVYGWTGESRERKER